MSDAIACRACGATLKPGAGFCAECGQATRPPPQRSTRSLFVAVWLYLALLAVNVGVMVYVRITGDEFGAYVAGTVGFAVVAFAFYLPARAQLRPVSSTAGLRWHWYVAILVGAVPIAAIVIGYVDGLSSLFGIHQLGELEATRGHSWMWTILLIAILPPLVEELSFRGVIFGALRDSLSVGETLIVSSFAFALLHLSIPSLLTHLPLGLYFGWLRHRSGSLWPGMFAHACHNGVIIAVAWLR